MTSDEREAFDKLFFGLGPDRAKEIDTSILKLIDHVQSRVSYTEAKRKAAIEVSLGFVTFAGPLLVLLYQYVKDVFHLAAPFLLGLLGVGFLDLLLYIYQERFTRPFIKAARTWRWFYHYSIKPEVPVGPFLGSEEKKRSIQGYLEGLLQYAENTLKASPERILAQDIEQLFILLFTEKLKNEFLKQQQGVLIYGSATSFVALVANVLMIAALRCYLGAESVTYAFLVSILTFLMLLAVLLRMRVFKQTVSREDWAYLPP